MKIHQQKKINNAISITGFIPKNIEKNIEIKLGTGSANPGSPPEPKIPIPKKKA